MSDSPSGTLQTKIGPVAFTMTDKDHVHLCSRNENPVTIRGIPYHVSFHVYLIDGVWKAKDCREPYMSRRDRILQEPSLPARKTAREMLATAWADYLKSRPGLDNEAAVAKLDDEINRLAGEIAELQQQVRDKEAEQQAKRKALAALKRETRR